MPQDGTVRVVPTQTNPPPTLTPPPCTAPTTPVRCMRSTTLAEFVSQDTIVQQEVAKPSHAVWVNTVRPSSFPLPQETVLLAISVMEQPVFPIPGNVTWATTAQRAPQCRWHVPLEHSQIAQATQMIHSACSVPLVNTVKIMDLPYPMEIALLGIIAQRARMYHSPPITPAAQGTSVKLEVGMRQDVHQECTNPTGPDPHVKYAQQAPTAKPLVTMRY